MDYTARLKIPSRFQYTHINGRIMKQALVKQTHMRREKLSNVPVVKGEFTKRVRKMLSQLFVTLDIYGLLLN